MAAQRVVTLGLALLGSAEDRIELIDGIAGHEGAQQRHGGTNHRQVDMEIRASETEQRTDVAAREQHRLDLETVGAVYEHDDERCDAAVADHAADDACGGAAIEGGVDDLHELGCRALPPTVEMRCQFAADLPRTDT